VRHHFAPPKCGNQTQRHLDRRVLHCAACGKRLERTARHQRFCSRKCRQRANYAKWVAEGRFDPLLSQHTGLPTHPIRKSLNGQHFPGRNSRPIPRVNVVPRRIIEAEILGRRKWSEVVSADGVRSEVTQLSRKALQ
jgi:endogenous inhibitor of DNA gyrase (YacG/DUF329 family)